MRQPITGVRDPVQQREGNQDHCFYSPPDGMLVHRWVTPSVKFAGTHLCTEAERGTVRVKGLAAQEHNTMSPDRAQTWTILIMRPLCLLHLRYKA